MDIYEVEIGRVVQAMAGRDKGKYFMIYNVISEEYVEIVNGNGRTLSHPKKKKLKHLKLKGEVLQQIASTIVKGETIHDPAIRRALGAFYEN